MLLLGFGLAFAGPIFAYYAAESAKMACCRRGKGSCCHRRQTGPGFTAAAECSGQCNLGAVSPQTDGAVGASSAVAAAEPALYSVISVSEEIHSRSHSYLAFLYQLPPPVATR